MPSHCCVNEDSFNEARCVLARRRRRATSLCRWKHLLQRSLKVSYLDELLSIGLLVGGSTLCVLCVDVHHKRFSHQVL